MTFNRESLLREAAHGGIDNDELHRYGIDSQSVVDLSSNILFVDQPDSVNKAIRQAAVSRYPDRNCGRLREVLADRMQVSKECLLVGNGCTELIHLVANTFLNSGDKVLVAGPTFAEYERASQLAGATIHEVNAHVEENFRVPVETIELELGRVDFHAVWLCNPNNPTGQSIQTFVLRRWIESHPQTLFVVDESYIEFSEVVESLIGYEYSNLIVLRSMTKSYALAGLRLGYLMTTEAMISELTTRRIPWSVNEVAQSVGLAALESQLHYDRAMIVMREEREHLVRELRQRSYQPLATDTGFMLIPVDDATLVRKQLLLGGVLVRDCQSFGLQDYIRIAVGDRAATNQLLNAMDGRETIPDSSLKTRSDNAEFRSQLYELFRMRRDVRRFRSDAIPSESLAKWIDAACMAPSVGLSQPWRFVSVNDKNLRERVTAEFESQNDVAAENYSGSKQDHYRELKLAGLREAPEHLAVFAETEPKQGSGLGRQTMPETVVYSVVAAIQNFWLATRCDGVGVGWISILRPEQVREILAVPPDWHLIAYLCIGYPMESAAETPELEVLGWEKRAAIDKQWVQL